jgi:hypothetical protein
MDSKQGFKKSSAEKTSISNILCLYDCNIVAIKTTSVVFDLNSSQDHNISKIVAWPELKAWKRKKN